MIWYMQYATNVSLWKRLLDVLSVGLEYFLALVPSPWPCFFCKSLALALNTKSLKTSLLTSEQGHFRLLSEPCEWNHCTGCSTVTSLVMACQMQWNTDILCPGHQHHQQTLVNIFCLTCLTRLKKPSNIIQNPVWRLAFTTSKILLLANFYAVASRLTVGHRSASLHTTGWQSNPEKCAHINLVLLYLIPMQVIFTE